MFDYSSLASTFWEEGYLVVEGFFEAEAMDHLDAVIRDHFGDAPEYWHSEEFLTRSRVEVVPWFPQRDGIYDFDPVGNDLALQCLTASILGEGWEEQYCMVMFSRQGSRGQSWHQDCPPEDPNRFNLNRLAYTHDITEETGGYTVVVPGTHRKGVLPAGEPAIDLQDQVILKPKKGTLVLLHGHTWHRVLPVHGRYRVSTNFRASPKGVPGDVTDVCVYRNMRYRFSTSEVVEERVPPLAPQPVQPSQPPRPQMKP